MIPLGGRNTGDWKDNFTVREGCDLRASLLNEKLPLIKTNEWKMLVNRKGTLAHIVHGGTGIYVRMPAMGGEAFTSPDYCRRRALHELRLAVKDLPQEIWL